MTLASLYIVYFSLLLLIAVFDYLSLSCVVAHLSFLAIIVSFVVSSLSVACV